MKMMSDDLIIYETYFSIIQHWIMITVLAPVKKLSTSARTPNR